MFHPLYLFHPFRSIHRSIHPSIHPSAQHKGWTYKDDARAKKKAAARTSTWTAHPQQQQLQLQQLLQLQRQLQLQQGGMSSAAAAAAACHCPQHRRQLCVGGMPLLGALVGGMPLSVPGGGLGLDVVRGAAAAGAAAAGAGASNLLQLLQGTAAAAAAALPTGLLPQQTAVSAPAPAPVPAPNNAHLVSTGIACMGMQQPPPQQQQQQGHADLPTIGFVAGAALGAAAAAQQQTQQQKGKESSGRPQPQPQPQPNVMPNEAAQLMIASYLAMQQQQQQQQQGLQRQDNVVNQAAFPLQQQMGRQMPPSGAVEHTTNNPNDAEARASSNDQDSVDGTANQEISHPPNPNLDQANSTGGASNAMPLISPNVFPGGGTVPPQPLDLSALGGNMYAYLLQQQANNDNNS